MNDTLKIIFDKFSNQSIENNPFESKETDRKLDDFLRTRFVYKDTEQFDEIFGEIISITSEIQEQAFSVGFYTAVELLTGRK